MLSEKFLINYQKIKEICDKNKVTQCHIERINSVGGYVMHVFTEDNHDRHKQEDHLKNQLQPWLSYGTDFDVHVHNSEKHHKSNKALPGIPLEDFIKNEFMRTVALQDETIMFNTMKTLPNMVNYCDPSTMKTPLMVAFKGLAESFGPPPNKEVFLSAWRILQYLITTGAQLTPTDENKKLLHPLTILFWHLPAKEVCDKHMPLHRQMANSLGHIVNAIVHNECEKLGKDKFDFSLILTQVSTRYAKRDETTKTIEEGHQKFLQKLHTHYPSLEKFFATTPTVSPQETIEQQQNNGVIR